jgi:NADH:ubiquinone oxidoreductase subunit 4 (subunit M)
MGAFQSEGMHLSTTTGEIAWAGIIAAQLVAALGVVLLAVGLSRRSDPEQVGSLTKIAAIGGAVVVAVVLVAPPIGTFGGGLLVRPLADPSRSSEPFREVFAVLTVLAATGVIFAAVYLLLATQKVFFGPIRHRENESLRDLSLRESLVLAPLVIAAVLMGLFPQPLLDAVNPSVSAYAQHVRARAGLPVMAQVRPGKPGQQLHPGQQMKPGQQVQPLPPGGLPPGVRSARPAWMQRRLPMRRALDKVQRRVDKQVVKP